VNLKRRQKNILTSKVLTAIHTFTAFDKPVELLKINGTVNGIAADLYFDSGATASLISSRLVKTHNIPISPIEVQIRSANNSIDQVKGITSFLKINVAENVCNLRLLVFDLGDIDVLLGLNWFKVSGAGLYPSLKLLKFGDTPIRLSNNEIDEDIENVNLMVADEDDLLPINIEIFSDKSDKIVTNSELTSDQNAKYTQLVDYVNNQNVFALGYDDIEGCQLLPHVRTTTTEKPIFIPRYRKSNFENLIISKEIDLMLKAKVIHLAHHIFHLSFWYQSLIDRKGYVLIIENLTLLQLQTIFQCREYKIT
jgi:hypothetical protein